MSDSSLDELSAKITQFIGESENVVAQVRNLIFDFRFCSIYV